MNKVLEMGRLTKDPELRYTSNNNTAVCNFTIAVPRRFKKDGQPEADFFNVVAWSKTGEFASKWFTKGLQVVVVGSLQNRSWDDNEGKKHYATDIVADEVYFADSKKSEGGNTSGASTGTTSGAGQSDAGFYPMDDSDELPF